MTSTESKALAANSFPPARRLERLFALLLFLLFLLMLQGLRRPAWAYPLSGLTVGLGLDGGAIVALLIIAFKLPRSAKCQWAALVSFLLYFLWADFSMSWSPLRSKGQLSIMGFLFGCWTFVIGFILSRLAPETTPEPGDAKFAKIASNPLGAAAIYVSAFILIFSLHALYQFFYGFEARLHELASLGIYQGDDPIGAGVRFALHQKRVFSVFGNPNHFACFLALGLPFALSLVLMKGARWLNVLGCVSFALGLEAALLTASRGGLLSIGVGLAAALVLAGKSALRDGLRPIVVGVLIFIVVAGTVGVIQVRSKNPNPDISSPTQDTVGESSAKTSLLERMSAQSTVRERIYYLQTALALFRRAPWAGNGAGAYEILYPQARQPGARESQNAHNFVAQVAVEQGLTGLILLLTAFALALHCMLLSWSNARSDRDAIGRLLALAPIAGCAAFLFNGLLDFGFYMANLFAFFSLILGLGVGSLRLSPSRLSATACFAFRAVLVASLVVLPGLPWLIPYLLSRHYEQQARDALDTHDPDQAALNYERALEFQPKDPYLMHALAATYRIFGEPREAVRLLRKAVDLFDESALIHNELAQAYLDLGNNGPALDEMMSAIQRHPLEARYRMNLAVLLLRLGHRDRALGAAREGVRLALDRAPIYSEFLNSLEEGTTPTLQFF